MKLSTLALVVCMRDDRPVLIDSLSDHHEIALLESAIQAQESDPLGVVYQVRERRQREDEAFGDYVEELLSQPCVRDEIRQHGLQWLRSQIRIERFRDAELEAARTIASFAFEIFRDDAKRDDFILSGPQASIRIRVIHLKNDAMRSGESSAA